MDRRASRGTMQGRLESIMVPSVEDFDECGGAKTLKARSHLKAVMRSLKSTASLDVRRDGHKMFTP